MRKVNVLIMSSALGIICAASPAVFAQTAPPGGPRTDMGETKPPFKVPNGGGFKYKGKPSQGQALLMEVKWQAAETMPNGTIRISGEVKYKNPKTEKMDVRSIDGSKSYITKTGELFFALNDIDGKVYGPVDLAALKDASPAKSDKPAQDKGSGSGGLGTGGAPSKTQGGGSVTNLDRSLNTPGMQDTPEDEGDGVSNTESSSTMSKKCGSKKTNYDDRFKAADSFKAYNKTFYWEQSNRTHGKNRVIIIKYANCATLGGQKRPNTLDDNGIISANIFGKNFRSKESFRSDNFKALAAAINQIKKENTYMKSYNLSSLPYATRDKKGNIIATDGTIILNAVIRSINSHKITHKKSALAIRAFDSNNSLLKMDGMGWIVHRFVDSAGLKVDHHKTRGRSLAPGQCSSYTYKQCAPNERSFVGQFSDNASLIAASPTPVSKPVNDIAEQRFCENGLKPHDVEKVAKRLNDMRRKAREEHADRLAEFLGNQRYIFLSPIDQNRITMNFQALAGTIDAIFVNARELRAGRIDEERFFVVRNRNVEAMRSYMQRGGLTAENLVNLILQMPGFQINNNLLEDAMRSRIVLNMNRNLSLYELRSSYDLPAGVIDLIRQLARLFVFRIAGKCDVITQPRAFEPIDLM